MTKRINIIALSLTALLLFAHGSQASVDVRGWERPVGAPNVESVNTWGTAIDGLQAGLGTTNTGPAGQATYRIFIRNVTGQALEICPPSRMHLIAETADGTALGGHNPSTSSFQPQTDTLRLDGGQTYIDPLGLTLQQRYSSVPAAAVKLVAEVTVEEAHTLAQCSAAPTIHLLTLPISL